MVDAPEIPAWVVRGKTVRELIRELQSIEQQDLEVRISIDYGQTDHPISLLARVPETPATAAYYRLESAEIYYQEGMHLPPSGAAD